LLAQRADPNIQEFKSGDTALHASLRSRLLTAETLLNDSRTLRVAPNKNGVTPLMLVDDNNERLKAMLDDTPAKTATAQSPGLIRCAIAYALFALIGHLIISAPQYDWPQVAVLFEQNASLFFITLFVAAMVFSFN